MQRPVEMAKRRVEESAQKWQTSRSAIQGWGTTARLTVILLVLNPCGGRLLPGQPADEGQRCRAVVELAP